MKEKDLLQWILLMRWIDEFKKRYILIKATVQTDWKKYSKNVKIQLCNQKKYTVNLIIKKCHFNHSIITNLYNWVCKIGMIYSRNNSSL